MNVRIGIDIGGTTMKAGIVDNSNHLIATHALPTYASRESGEILEDIKLLVLELLTKASLSENSILSIGIGVPGTANQQTGILEYANNLNLNQVNICEYLEKAFYKPVRFENDAKAAAWAEYLLGAGKGTSSMVMMTLGTGIGGGIIINHRLWSGCNYAAGELGHMTIEHGGRPCTCGRDGCFEAYASASALIWSAKEQLPSHPNSLLWSLCQNNLDLLDGKAITTAVTRQDPIALSVWNTYLGYLAEGTANIINILQPDLLCIGGGLSQSGDLLLSPLKELVDKRIYTKDSQTKTQLTLATLGNDAGILGAALLEP